MTTTVFLDRDGVINEKPVDGMYVTSWHEFKFLPGAAEAIRMLNQAGAQVIVVTNQRGVALGIMTDEDVREIHREMLEDLHGAGARLDAVYFCPHAEGSCDCRKPGIGLFLKAKTDFPDIVFEDAFVIGDSDRDMDAGRRLGTRLIRIGRSVVPDELCARSLVEAVTRYVLASVRKPAR